MLKWLVLILVAVCGSVFAQTPDEPYAKLPWPNTFSLGYYQVDFPGVPIQHALGYNGEYLITPRWGMEWSVALADKYFQAGLGSFVGPIVILLHNNTPIKSGPLLVFVVAVCTAAEQTNYHIPLARGVELVPFVSLVKYRDIYEVPGYPVGGTGSWSAGIKLSLIHREKWFLNLVGEAGRLYHEGTPSFVLVGVNIGFFSRRDTLFN